LGLDITVWNAGRGSVFLNVSGSLDKNTADIFNDKIRTLPSGTRAVSIDLSGISEITSAGIGALAARAHELMRDGLSVQIIRPSPQVARFLHHANLDGILKEG
jgi:anti-anti-sigma factor